MKGKNTLIHFLFISIVPSVSSDFHLWLTRPALLFVLLSSSLLSFRHNRGPCRLGQLQPNEGCFISSSSSASTGPPRTSRPPSSDASALQEGRGAAVQQFQMSRVPNAVLWQGWAGHPLPADQSCSQLSESLFHATATCSSKMLVVTVWFSFSSVSDMYAMLASHDAA